jgi:orotidine-5'-phosphate decarboxylase
MELLQRKAPVVIPLLERYAQNNLHSGQEKLLLQLWNISFQELVEQVPNFENMLWYIGVVLSATEDAEKKTRILTNALVPGIIEYLEKKWRNKKFYEKIVQGNESVLSRQDLSQLEIISH